MEKTLPFYIDTVSVMIKYIKQLSNKERGGLKIIFAENCRL